MNRKLIFRGMDHSDALDKDMNAHIDKMAKYFKQEHEPITIDAILESHREKHYFIVEFRIQTPDYHIIAREEGASMYQLMNAAGQKAVQEIIKKKDKHQTEKDHRHRR